MTWSKDDGYVDPAFKPLEEAGQGESEGFELAERDLIEHASHADDGTPTQILFDAEGLTEASVPEAGLYGEADEEHHPDG